MDVYCSRCGEPYDVFSLTDDMTKEERADFHAGRGCPCCRNTPDDAIDLSERQKDLLTVQSALKTVLGDDIDGLAAELEDLGF